MNDHIKSKLMAAVFALATLATLPAHAALFAKSPDKSAEEAASANMLAVTVWVDASWGFRKQGAANDLSATHRAFTTRGYKVASVEPYIENGDLQGFFVTYQKPRQPDT